MNLSKLINSKLTYNFLNKYVPYLVNENNLILHNKNRLKYMGPSFKTYEGRSCCGATCYSLNFLLNKFKINNKLMIKK